MKIASGLGAIVGALLIGIVGLLLAGLAVWLIAPIATADFFAPDYVQSLGIAAGLGVVGSLLRLNK